MRLRQVFIWAGLLALIAAVLLNLGKIEHLSALLHHARWYVLALILVVQAISYYCNARYYQAMFKTFGYRVRTRELYKAALAINFVNQVFPSGGLSGTSFLSQSLRDQVPAGKATFTQFLRYFFTFLSYLVVLVSGWLLLFLSGSGGRVAARVTLLIMLFIIIGALILIALVGDRPRIEWVGRLAVRLVNAVSRGFGRRKRVISSLQLSGFFDEFYHGYDTLRDQKALWRQPLWWCLAGSIAEISTVYVVFMAFAPHFINPGVVIAAYTLANLLSLLAVFTGGLGLYEATMITTFVTLGVPFALSVSVVLVYRALNFLLFLPVGFYYYRKQL